MALSLNGIHGTVTDSITGKAVEAEIFIKGHDHHGSSVSSHFLFNMKHQGKCKTLCRCFQIKMLILSPQRKTVEK